MGKHFMRIQEKIDKPLSEPEESQPIRVSTEDNKQVSVPDKLRKVMDEKDVRIVAPKYTTIEKGNIKVDFAIIKDDYYYQLEFRKKPNFSDNDVLALIIHECSSVIPNHVDVYIHQPPREVEWEVYTIIAKGAAKLLNAKEFMEDKLANQFLDLQLWPKSASLKRIQ